MMMLSIIIGQVRLLFSLFLTVQKKPLSRRLFDLLVLASPLKQHGY